MDKLLAYISNMVLLESELKESILDSFHEVRLKKGEFVLEEGKKATHLYFIQTGMLHTYYYHEEKRVSSWFYEEDQFITSWSSFYQQKASFESIECLEDCTLYQISFSDYQRLIQSSHAFSQFARLLTEELLIVIDEFSKNWAYLSAEERYKLLLYYCPQIELRVKLGLIASFLGISQETLSRIRAKK